MLVAYEKAITYSKNKEILVVSDSNGFFEFNVEVLSRYENGFKSSSNNFLPANDVRPGKKMIRIRNTVFLGSELWAIHQSGEVFKHAEKTGCIDLIFKKGITV